MRKILIITYYWPPSGGAGVQRILKFVKHLPALGYKPYVVTVNEDQASYPFFDHTFEKDIPEEAEVVRTPTFEPFNIYSKVIGKRSIPTGFSNESKPGLLMRLTRFIRGNFFIPDARRGWVKFAVKEAGRIITKEKIDTVICTSPPHSAQLCGMILKKKYGVKWIADLRDPWTDIYYYDEFYHLPYARYIDKCLEMKTLKESDAIVTVSHELKKLFLSKSDKITPDKVTVIHNGFDEDDFRITDVAASSDFVIGYTGTLADSYEPGSFLMALKNAIEAIKEIGITLHLVGNPSETVRAKAEELGISEHVRYTPTVPHEESVRMLLSNDALLLLIPRVKNDKGILTGKLFEYLASGKPVIGVGPVDGDAAKILNECNAGQMFERGSTDQMTEYIVRLAEAKAGRIQAGKTNDNYLKYSRKAQAAKLAELIAKISE